MRACVRACVRVKDSGQPVNLPRLTSLLFALYGRLRNQGLFVCTAKTGRIPRLIQVSKGAKIRNRYNQVPHLTQDTNGKVTNSQLDTTNESQEVSPFPAGDHKAHINRRAQRHSKHKTEQKHKRSTKEGPPLERSVKYFTGGLKPVSRRSNLTLISDVDQDT